MEISNSLKRISSTPHSKTIESSSMKSKSPIKNLKENKLGEDEFMAAAIGDTEWLRQSLRGSRGALTYDSNVSRYRM